MSSWSETLSDEIMISSRTAFDRFDHENSGTINVEVTVMTPPPLPPCILLGNLNLGKRKPERMPKDGALQRAPRPAAAWDAQ